MAGQWFGLMMFGLIILTAVALVVQRWLLPPLLRWYVERRAVAPAAYVAYDDAPTIDDRVSAHGKAEKEDSAETEIAGKAPALSSSQLTELLEQTRRDAAARALGTLLGSGLIVEDGRTRAMVALFGPPGRKHGKVKPLVDAAEAAAAAERPPEPEKEARVIPIADGKQGYVEMT